MKQITLEDASNLVKNATDLKNKEAHETVGATNDVEALVGSINEDFKEGYDVESLEAGMRAATAAASVEAGTAVNVIPFPPAVEGTKLIDVESSAAVEFATFDMERFEPLNQSMTKEFAFTLAANTMSGDAGLDLMYPVVDIPANAEGAVITMPFGLIKSKFKRDDVKLSGETRLNEQSILSGLRNPSIVNSDANLLVPVYTDASKDKLDTDFKNDSYKHPTTGELIATAPILFDSTFDLTTIAHTAKLVTDGVFADETSLDIGGRITYVYGKIGADKFKFDVSSLPMNEIITGGSGDFKDIVLNIHTESFTIDPAKIKQADGSASTELAAVPAGIKLVYSLDINGNGNMTTCDWGVRKPTLKLLKVVDVDGNTMPVDAGDGKTAYDIGVKLELSSYDLYQTVTNADLKVVANTIDIGELAQRVGIGYGALDSYPSTLLTEGNTTKASLLVPTATVRTLTRRRDLQQKALNEVLVKAGFDVNGGRTKTITSTVVNAYNVTDALDLADMLDAEEHGKRELDIMGLITSKIKAIIPAMLFDTNYAALCKAYGRQKPAIGITFGTDLLPFMPESISLPGCDVKLAMTEVASYKSDIFVYPIDANHNSKVITPLGLGVRLSKPDIVVTGRFGKVKGTFVVPRTRVVNTVSIIHRFKVGQIQAALGKITRNEHTV